MRNKKAFTLAETLITLAIIGIVSAITIPNLINTYQTKTWNTGANLFEKKLKIALQIMNSQQTLIGHITTENFIEELSKHIKITKICDNDNLIDCFNDSIYWLEENSTQNTTDISTIKKAKNFGHDNWDTNIIGLQFANGITSLIAYNPINMGNEEENIICKQDPYSNKIEVTNCIAMIYDTSGYKAPNTRGKDIRSINVPNLGNGCLFKIGKTCYSTILSLSEPMTYAKCAGENATTVGVKTPAGEYASKFGIKNCYYDNDYWASAAEACGGADKLPTEQQLTDLANYLYNSDKVTQAGTTSNLKMDMEKLSLFNFTLDSSNIFVVWSNNEANGQYTYSRYFHKTRSGQRYSTRETNNHYTLCIGN